MSLKGFFAKAINLILGWYISERQSAYLYSPVRQRHFVASFCDPVVPSFLHPRKVVAAVIVLHAISEGVRLGLKITGKKDIFKIAKINVGKIHEYYIWGQGWSGSSQFWEQQEEVCFQQKHNQGLRQLFMTLSLGPRPLQGTTHDGVLVSLKFRKQCTRHVEGNWSLRFQLKKPFKSLRRRQGSCWQDPKRKVYLWGGIIVWIISPHWPPNIWFLRQHWLQ